MRHIVALMAAVALTGCYKHLELDTEPTGAMVTQSDGQTWRTPATLSYPAPMNESGCVETQPLTITWASGAETTYKPELCGGASTVYKTIPRPSHPGLSQDRIEAQRRKDEIGNQQAMAAAYIAASFAQGMAAGAQSYTPPPRVECESRVFGNTVRTTCD